MQYTAEEITLPIQEFNTLDMFIIFHQANTNVDINARDTYLERSLSRN